VEVRITPVHQGLRRIAVEHRYDMRHQCQEILPGLLLGPFQVSKNQLTLNELGISHMYASCSKFLHIILSFVSLDCLVPRVCIRDEKEAFSVRPRFPDAFEYLVLDVQDSEEQNLIRLFPKFV
jgi:serine/threonine/tyrosine-interacting protein